jgi:hypothetical protein
MTKSAQTRKPTARRSPEADRSARDEPARDAPLNFKVSAEFRREFKTYAAQHNKKLNQLLHEAFAALKNRHA